MRRSRKIRFYPNNEQRKILRNWFGCARYVYNRTIEYLKQPGTKANWKKIKKAILDSLPDWAKQTPFQIKSIAIKDACEAVKNAKQKFRKTRIIQDVKFKSRKKRNECIYIPKKAVREDSFYVSFLGKILFSETIGKVMYDCRIVLQYGRYFLVKPEDKPVLTPESQRNRIVALDPGCRTFETFFATSFCGKIGQDFGRIHRLCYYMDNLISRISKAKSKARYRMRKALDRMRWKIKDLIAEIHHKTANFLCKLFDLVIIPPFKTQKMVPKLHSKTSRAMLTWAHYKFRTILNSKAQRMKTTIVEQNEAYTSKTCSNCGFIDFHLRGKKKFVCPSCSITMDRDFNGARGIFLRALEDNPWLNSL